MADRGRNDSAGSLRGVAARADGLLREAIALLDSSAFDRAAAYADMARAALTEAAGLDIAER
jgi:hypothetical protein